jgi:hypothetical protein
MGNVLVGVGLFVKGAGEGSDEEGETRNKLDL